MKKMKRNLCTVLAMCLSLSLAACGYGFDDSKSESSSSETETTSAATSPDETEPTSSESTETTTDCEPFSEVSVTDSKTEQQGGSDEGNSNFQQQFKSDSIKEYYSVLDGIRTGITLNREHETEKMIAAQAVNLINWSRGTTLTSEEIETEWENYTSGWEKDDYQSFASLYGLVYDECRNISGGKDDDILEELDYSFSDFAGLELPLEPMKTLNYITSKYMSAGDFQTQFKADSIKEYYSVLEGIRTGITLNREHETEKMIAAKAILLISWSRGTTLTSSEIETEWNNYTSDWEKGDYQAFATLYGLVYDECGKIVNGEDNDTLAELGYSYSDFEGLNLPLEAMDTLNRIV